MVGQLRHDIAARTWVDVQKDCAVRLLVSHGAHQTNEPGIRLMQALRGLSRSRVGPAAFSKPCEVLRPPAPLIELRCPYAGKKGGGEATPVLNSDIETFSEHITDACIGNPENFRRGMSDTVRVEQERR
jgi:hypothetical protein